MKRPLIVLFVVYILWVIYQNFGFYLKVENILNQTSEAILFPNDYSRLLDLRNFEFSSWRSCRGILVALVHSAPANFEHRNAIRSTWGRQIQTAFLIGKTNFSTQKGIDHEIKMYNDIVQGSFLDSYRNMTYKHIMGLKWALYHCPHVKFILKTDDDVLVNLKFFKAFLAHLWPSGTQKLLLCSVVPQMIAKRGYRNKWRVTPLEYPDRYFPRYCAGWAVVYSHDVALDLYSEAQRSKYFWIDDIFVTGILAKKLNITHTNVRGPLAPIGTSKINPRVDFLFGLLTSPSHFHHLWTQINK